MIGVDVARMLVSAMCCGMMEVSLAFAIRAVAERSAFGLRTIEFQGVQWMLADVATDLSATELLFKAAASKLDRGERATIEDAHAKKFATRVALNAVVQCMQLTGARGLLAETPISRHLAGAKSRSVPGWNDRDTECCHREVFSVACRSSFVGFNGAAAQVGLGISLRYAISV
jgi:alkylation response protein AidB-like acyl-CoA dehydrogenase